MSEQKLCDPCQIKERGHAEICGWSGRSLVSHIKAHKTWTIDKYKKKFPNASVGEPTYRPPKGHVENMRAANPKVQPPTVEEPQLKSDDKDDRIKARAEVLWNLVERDPAAEINCALIAKDELTLQELHERADAFALRGEFDDLQALNKSIDLVQKRMLENQKSLGVTADQRRQQNKIGSDAGTQIISNYQNTLRKMSPARRDIFERRFATWKTQMEARVKAEIIDLVEDQFDAKDTVVHEGDFRDAILAIGKRV
jgi:hypothetical protein